MDVDDLERLEDRLDTHPARFGDCFGRSDTRAHLTTYVLGRRVTLGGQLPTRMVLRNVSNELKELGLSISLNRLDASARTPDGNVLMVRKVVLFGTDRAVDIVPNGTASATATWKMRRHDFGLLRGMLEVLADRK